MFKVEVIPLNSIFWCECIYICLGVCVCVSHVSFRVFVWSIGKCVGPNMVVALPQWQIWHTAMVQSSGDVLAVSFPFRIPCRTHCIFLRQITSYYTMVQISPCHFACHDAVVPMVFTCGPARSTGGSNKSISTRSIERLGNKNESFGGRC